MFKIFVTCRNHLVVGLLEEFVWPVTAEIAANVQTDGWENNAKVGNLENKF